MNVAIQAVSLEGMCHCDVGFEGHNCQIPHKLMTEWQTTCLGFGVGMYADLPEIWIWLAGIWAEKNRDITLGQLPILMG